MDSSIGLLGGNNIMELQSVSSKIYRLILGKSSSTINVTKFWKARSIRSLKFYCIGIGCCSNDMKYWKQSRSVLNRCRQQYNKERGVSGVQPCAFMSIFSGNEMIFYDKSSNCSLSVVQRTFNVGGSGLVAELVSSCDLAFFLQVLLFKTCTNIGGGEHSKVMTIKQSITLETEPTKEHNISLALCFL